MNRRSSFGAGKDRGPQMKKALTLGLIVASFLLGVGAAHAAHNYGGYTLHQASSASDHCIYHRPSMRVPSNAPGQQMDFNGWIYRKDYRSDIGCNLNNAAKNFDSGTYAIQAILARTDNLSSICSYTSNVNAPSGTSGYGWGRPYSKQGICNGTNNFTVWSKATSWWNGGLQTSSFMTGSF